MATFPGDWALCGGWAVDAWLGRQSREHQDVDIAVFQDDLPALLHHFDGWQLLAHDDADPDSETQWKGRSLSLPAHIHARQDDVNLDVQVSERQDDRLVLNRDPPIRLALRDAVTTCDWGLPTLAPQLVLYYKALERRPQDEVDLAVLLPLVSRRQARWLSDAAGLMKLP
jgi:hypothetical protein